MHLGNRRNQHSFAQIPNVKIGRSKFDRSSTVKDTAQFDELFPIFVDEVLPGDTFNLSLNMFARLATQKVPIMDNMYIDFFWFYVPNRLVWDNWEKFNGAQTDPEDSTDYILPQMTFPAGGPEVGSIYDKFGLPTDVTLSWTLNNTLPLRGYNLIWNEWFRDQNLQDSLIVPKDDGPDTPADFVLKKRGKRHDYFTSALPWPQKGPAISLPLGEYAPLTLTDGVTVGTKLRRAGDDTLVNSFNFVSPDYLYTTSNGTFSFHDDLPVPTNVSMKVDVTGHTQADLSEATAVTVNALREAIQLQGLFELDARGGTRYTEILKAHFGVTSPDFRLQRPEFLGSGQVTINSHPVAQTAPTTEDSTPQGNLSAFATAQVSGNRIGFSKSFVEHGYVFGLACARADITYQQGINRMWNRSTRFDFFWPKLQELGEQEILNKEIYTTGDASDENVFGYQERYAEYRYKPSEIHGKFRSTYAQSLDVWHLAQEFAMLPGLTGEFIEQDTPIERAIAVTSEPHLLIDGWIKLTCARPMATYSVPATLGRF